MTTLKNPITPFPADINRDYFGAWLSGFTDGEGCFRLDTSKQGGRYIPKAAFQIGLRDDDSEVLYLIQSYFMCGLVMQSETKLGNPQTRLLIRDVSSLWEKVVPHFNTFPLLAKKKNDFVIWREGVCLMHDVTSTPFRNRIGSRGRLPRWNEQDLDKFYDLQDSLLLQRMYVETVG